MMTVLNPADPITALIAAPQSGVLAIISDVEGTSYRAVGAMMAVMGPDQRVGTLSSGCIEEDISAHALQAQDAGKPVQLRYGKGSPFFDLQLPCGGGVDILLLPNPDRQVLCDLAERRAARAPVTLLIHMDTGAMVLGEAPITQRLGNTLSVHFQPDVQFLIFGNGPEASSFAALAQSVGAPTVLLSPDTETLAVAEQHRKWHLTHPELPEALHVDSRTAIVTFFHDHDWEPAILQAALETDAFYIGSQGSRRARDARHLMLETMGVKLSALARLKGPIGLIPSTRDATTLAVSVLAEVFAEAQTVSN